MKTKVEAVVTKDSIERKRVFHMTDSGSRQWTHDYTPELIEACNVCTPRGRS